MKRLTLMFRKSDGTRMRTYRLNIPEPVDSINPTELTQDMQQLKQLGVVPDGFEPDEARLTETNVEILVNLIE
ncbi:Protein of unknown function [Fervidobacterium changbaicum]|uniref:DUF2922 domain-containing protein n=2 Tax=Fervidobacterium TaxID=2422 RepID=A0AAI8CMQ4_FERIS|nr:MULTISPECIES: DUF2922 domain-containing protein [Fervidobacterium]AMW33065.1 DUF2922 domain-containing protein [Fervidobacterium islandicum]QAV33108.1 DUF2922 domain-containing protein [Fervidobacterium changbaicum]SDH10451.1 Protein of unknown function [Fervidobacterium changbaicum]